MSQHFGLNIAASYEHATTCDSPNAEPDAGRLFEHNLNVNLWPPPFTYTPYYPIKTKVQVPVYISKLNIIKLNINLIQNF